MLGLLGGTFNPIHRGHLSIAQDVFQFLNLEAVHLLPCHTPVHRDVPSASIQQRLAMLHLAIKDQAHLKLNLSEVDRGGASYMIDTLKYLTQKTSDKWVLILGTDAFNGLHQWHQSEQILDYCHIVVCQRPSQNCTQTQFNQHLVNDVSLLSDKVTGCIILLEVKPVPCSASFIRENSANKQAITQFLPQPVLEFMQSNSLYVSNKI